MSLESLPCWGVGDVYLAQNRQLFFDLVKSEVADPQLMVVLKRFTTLHLEAHLNRLYKLCSLSQIGSKDQDVKLPAKSQTCFRKPRPPDSPDAC